MSRKIEKKRGLLENHYIFREPLKRAERFESEENQARIGLWTSIFIVLKVETVKMFGYSVPKNVVFEFTDSSTNERLKRSIIAGSAIWVDESIIKVLDSIGR